MLLALATGRFDAGQAFILKQSLTQNVTARLPAHFIVWLCSKEAQFLNARLVWANWDPLELMFKKNEIQRGREMLCGVTGWPYLPQCLQGPRRRMGNLSTESYGINQMF